MEQIPIDEMIAEDMNHFFRVLNDKNKMTVEHVVELSSYVAANFMRIIYNKQKNISKEEVNGVLGIISNILNQTFADDITQEDYQKIAHQSLEFIKNTDFDEQSQIYFRNLLHD